MQKSLRMIHPEQEKQQKQPWDRMPGEPARYFMLFRRYCEMGRGRSLQALWEQEHPAQTGTESAENTNAPADAPSPKKLRKVSVSGTWKKAAATWKWHERAEEYDGYVRDEKHKILLGVLDHESRYITKAQRLDTLDALVCGLMACFDKDSKTFILTHGGKRIDDFKLILAYTRQIQSVLRQIAQEMKDFEGITHK